MKLGNVVVSAAGAAAARTVESYRPEEERLFEDRFARDLLPPVWRFVVDLLRAPGLDTALLAMRERRFPGVLGNLICRTRFIDDSLRAALEQDLRQVVILGAGFDSRAYRIPGIERARVFEVDHPDTQAWKQERLREIQGTLPAHVTFVPIDFDRQRLEDAMAAQGFRTGTKTFFVWEGVTQYITAEAVDATFRYVSQAAGAGSEVVFTYIHRGIIDGYARSDMDRRLVSLTRRFGMPWIFGIDPGEVGEYLAARGLELVDHGGPAEYRARYLDPLDRQMSIFAGEQIALARVASTAQGVSL